MDIAVVITFAFVPLSLVRLLIMSASLVVADLPLVARPLALLDQVVVFVGEGDKCRCQNSKSVLYFELYYLQF